jgi:hypothetical protein
MVLNSELASTGIIKSRYFVNKVAAFFVFLTGIYSVVLMTK